MNEKLQGNMCFEDRIDKCYGRQMRGSSRWRAAKFAEAKSYILCTGYCHSLHSVTQ